MAVSGGTTIDLAELECAVREAEAASLLVPPRILRRVIKRDRGLTFLGWHVSRRKSYVIAGDRLRAIVAEDELSLWPESAWPDVAILLVRPEPKALATRPREEVLLEYWRLLFHGRVELAVWRRFVEGAIPAGRLRDRIDRIGPTAFEEIRNVLRQEGYLLPPRDNAMVYNEFAAVFLELRRFAPALLPHFFPAIEDPDAIEEMLAEDVDAVVIAAETRLPDAPDPRAVVTREGDREGTVAAPSASVVPHRKRAKAAKSLFRWLIVNAERAGARGNVVRAAFDRARAGLLVGPLLAIQASVGARNELDRLVLRLQAALGFDEGETEAWSEALPPLLDRAIHGFWTPEGRLLYDLQKVCLDHEREVFTVDLFEWAISLGRRPLKRSLPHLREVLMSNHLRSASKRLRAARIGHADRVRLADLIHPAVRRAEGAVRDRFRPLIAGVLRTNRIVPHNQPETVAYHKLIEELLDRIVLRGFLSLGDLRDACSRSNLKLPDVSGPSEFFRGDRLLETDRALGLALDGVYRRGEIYLRWLQRLSALAFATPTGRFLTVYGALPYGGAFVILEGLQHLVGPLVHRFAGLDLHLMNWASVLLIGTVATGLVNFVGFRRHFLKTMRQVGRGLRAILIDAPARFLRLRVIRLVLDSRVALILWRYLIKPLLVAVPLGLLGPASGLPRAATGTAIAIVFVPAMIVMNSRLGRDAEEILADSAVRIWRQLFLDILPGLFRLILMTFDRILEAIERLLYAVDEWLRFRSGQRRSALIAKGVLGLGWFFVAYLVRIYVNLLIEPQINPIKHFPVVTVSHKVILPLSLRLTRLLAAPLSPLGPQFSLFVAGTTVLLLPGVFGFLVWELKENWRLYESNRAESLRPVVVGGHGETMGGLLRPGFHSGTLPKLFAKLRRSEGRARDEVDEKKAFKRLESLHHSEELIREFVERDFIALLSESRSLHPAAIEVGEIQLATNRIRAELRSAVLQPSAATGSESPAPSLWIEFDELHDALIAGILEPGWLPQLTDEQSRVLSVALIGLFKMCGVDWVHALVLNQNGNRVTEPSTVIVPGSGIYTEVYDSRPLRDHRNDSRPRPDGEPATTAHMTTLIPFATVTVTWKRWVEAWEREQAGAKHTARFIEGFSILPRTESPRKRPARSTRRHN